MLNKVAMNCLGRNLVHASDLIHGPTFVTLALYTKSKEVIEGYLCISVKNGLMQVAALVL